MASAGGELWAGTHVQTAAAAGGEFVKIGFGQADHTRRIMEPPLVLENCHSWGRLQLAGFSPPASGRRCSWNSSRADPRREREFVDSTPKINGVQRLPRVCWAFAPRGVISSKPAGVIGILKTQQDFALRMTDRAASESPSRSVA
jgi:hypothetical protein